MEDLLWFTHFRNNTSSIHNKLGRAIRCVFQAEIVVLGGFALMLTDERTDRPSYKDASTHLNKAGYPT